MNSKKYVLVEEEAMIRRFWTEKAKHLGLSLSSFGTPEEFLFALEVEKFTGIELFYLDQDFGDRRAVGSRLARIIRDRWPDSEIRLITAYPRAFFRDELKSGLLTDVCGKYPAPFENPEYTLFENAFEKIFWAPFIDVLRGPGAEVGAN